jgi:hypothetical protein
MISGLSRQVRGEKHAARHILQAGFLLEWRFAFSGCRNSASAWREGNWITIERTMEERRHGEEIVA